MFLYSSLFMTLALAGTITYALLFEDSSGWYGLFLSWPSFLVVFGGGTGIIIMRKHTYQDNKLGKNLKRDYLIQTLLQMMIKLIYKKI